MRKLLGLLAALLITLPAASAGAAAPVNDDFAEAIALSGAPLDVEGTIVGSTREPGEPLDESRKGSVWYAWTAPASGRYRIDTCGSDLQVELDVFTGTQLDQLQSVPTNEIWCSTVRRGVFLKASGSETYRFAVSATDAQEGAFRLGIRLMPQPVNDDFADAVELSGLPVSVTGTTVDAQAETQQPIAVGAGSVWYAWTVPATGVYRIQTCSSGAQAAPLVYAGTTLAGLVPLTPYEYPWQTGVCKAGSGGWVVVRAAEGRSLRIPVSMRESWLTRGEFTLAIDVEPPPANDAFAAARTLEGATEGLAAAASAEPGEPSRAGRAPEHTVWYRWQAPWSGPTLLDVDGNVGAAVYTGSALGALAPVGTTAGPEGTRKLDAVAGTTYRIAIDWSSSATPGLTDGRFAIEMRRAPTEPPVDPPVEPPVETPAPTTGTPLGESVVDRLPVARIARIGRRPRTVRGTASDDRGVAKVEIAIRRRTGARCVRLTAGGAFRRARCGAPAKWLAASGTTSWAYRLPRKLRKGTYTVSVRVTDSGGRTQTTKRTFRVG